MKTPEKACRSITMAPFERNKLLALVSLSPKRGYKHENILTHFRDVYPGIGELIHPVKRQRIWLQGGK